MIHLSLRNLPIAVCEAVHYVIETLGLDINERFLVVDTASGGVQIEGQAPRRRSGVIVHPCYRESSFQLPDQAARFLLERCFESGVDF